MSRTLFIYIFRDLFRIFMMASGAMAGIMSFGGLLRPLTREGLDAGQVARMLTYFGPAMTTYSFPVAALFATAVVYGRLSADNELTACKAGGISLLSLSVTGPALVLGLLVAIVSLLFLCFIVPASTLKVEKVIYSNLAKLVESRIERTHAIPFQQATIFAQEAHVIPPGPDTPKGLQQVELIGPTIVSMTKPDPQDRTFKVPKEFYTASRAYVYIEPQSDGEEVNVTIRLKGGFKFPRQFTGATEMGIAETVFGPTTIPSPIREDVKFMDVWKLKDLYRDISQSRRIQNDVADFVNKGQKIAFLEDLADELNKPGHSAQYVFENGDRYSLSIEGERVAVVSPIPELAVVPALDGAPLPKSATAPATRTTDKASVQRLIVLRETTADQGTLVVRAASMTVHAQPYPDSGLVRVSVDLRDCLQTMESGGVPQKAVPRDQFPQYFTVPMNSATRALSDKGLGYFESPAAASWGNQNTLRRDRTQLMNAIVAESNGRASFAISCLILVMVGSALGMMFRSGNFLTAFAVSFVPALLSITLIIAGQRTAANVSYNPGAANPLQLGLFLIWAGNAVNLCLAGTLLWKLQRR